MREHDRLDVCSALADQPEHHLGLEVGVDHDRVVGGLVLDQVRVGAEPSVSC